MAAKLTQALLTVLLLPSLYLHLVDGNGAWLTGCREGELRALLEFKHGLVDRGGRLSSWAGGDCCSWRGVRCDNRTGHVIQLDLHGTGRTFDANGFATDPQPLVGDISPSLLGLHHLTSLDLSYNFFRGAGIPSFLGSFTKLRYLNLSSAGFSGSIPHQLGNLSRLRYLDLSIEQTLSGYNYHSGLQMVGSRWLSNLTSLRHLNLNGVELSRAPNWLKSVNSLGSISEIHLARCGLSIPLALEHANLWSLRVLDLSDNMADSTVPLWLLNISSLECLYLSGNSFQDLVPGAVGNLISLKVLDLSRNGVLANGVPTALRNLCSLNSLDLSGNNFSGQMIELGEAFSGCLKDSLQILSWDNGHLTGLIPSWIGNLKSLRSLDLSFNSFHGAIPPLQLPSLEELDLSHNRLNGTIPNNLGRLFPELVALYFQSNHLVGVLTEAHFANLSKLEYLYLTSNSLEILLPYDWTPPLGLQEIDTGHCTLGPKFPGWLRKLNNISSINMANAKINDVLPDWFWNFSPALMDVDLSHNDIQGELPHSLEHLGLGYLDLSHNHLGGPTPRCTAKLQELLLRNNSISGVIFPEIGQVMPRLLGLDLSSNNLTGSIPTSICRLKHLISLDLSKNHIASRIPDCWNSSEMVALDLSFNNLYGGIPASIGSLRSLGMLHLGNNDLSGELPLSLRNFTALRTLDLGRNKLSGQVPSWLGENSFSFNRLRLRSNMFTGSIPPELGSLDSLLVLDLANNHLSGAIPPSLGNLSAMKTAPFLRGEGVFDYRDNIDVRIKGRDATYVELLELVLIIDLSNNELSGEIPKVLGELSQLKGLSLAKNKLTGQIPSEIGQLTWLESLDLSENNISGRIPASMILMTSLSYLNLSYNNLYGKIPLGGQLQALPFPSIYVGNYGLCGFPLDVDCHEDRPLQLPGSAGGGGEGPSGDDEAAWSYLSAGLGFAFGLLGVCGVLLVNKGWCFAYFQYMDRFCDMVYVALVVNWKRMKRSGCFRRRWPHF